MDYPVIARFYLRRAKHALRKRDPRTLFYAAFELRCCVEARQAEYAEALVALKGSKIKPWNVGDTGKRIRKNSIASSITLMHLKFPDGSEYSSYHTPITDELIGVVERDLTPLLHCQMVYRKQDDPWWDEVRSKIRNAYRLAWLACQGDSMTPPLGNLETGEMHPAIIEMRDHDGHVTELIQKAAGHPMEVHISSPDGPPAHWKCDL